VTTSKEVADLWTKGDQRVARQAVAPVANAYGKGYVDSYDAGLRKAAVREGSRTAQPTPGFDVAPSLELQPGDYVLYREIGSDRFVYDVLDRNASVDRFANPLTTPGQILVAGADGTPTVIDPPADPASDYTFKWVGANQAPGWVAD
jgi:hypothetical protein